MQTELQAYLDRIGYRGPVEPTLQCLAGIHRSHALTIPYENLDIQFEIPIDHAIDRIFDKLVTRKRGGWCYEMNGLLGWALQEIGFDVLRAPGGIHRRECGDPVWNNHLVLLIKLDRFYIADLGLGDGMREPLPLQPGTYRQSELDFRVEALEDDTWRIFNHSFGYPTDYDLRIEPADEARLNAYASELQTSPASVFVETLDCELMKENSIACLTGRVLRNKTRSGTQRRLLTSPQDMHDVLRCVFGIEGVDIEPIWPKICARHAHLFGAGALQDAGD
ncbi:arylamine N-acetyltransferase family protein [Aestuariivirga sp.]|uniref:arylamine N-acetyltransferase family protein n=1 Tax=Aestuariivirga sp. TaxID=2650926 RepID=UPI003BAB3A10